jgi:ethanolamine utilization protein EutA
MRRKFSTTARERRGRHAARPSLNHYHPDPDHTPDGYREHDEPDGVVADNPLWLRDNVVLMSVGIDVGSAGTQILFSRIHLCRQAVDLSTRYLISGRETLFESPVSLTPYAGDKLIDARRLGELVDDAYYHAHLRPEDIDTGVVILTGEALRRENAEPIARILSEKCGDLVCASAGHHMEAMLAAHGSGAVGIAAARGLRLLNVDIGGGTTKLTLIDRGHVVATAALHVGSRLIAVDEAGCVERLEPAGAEHARRAGVAVALGTKLSDADRSAIAESMADDLVAALAAGNVHDDIAGLFLTDPLPAFDAIDYLLCSGGVAEYVYEREERDFGDLGKRLGAALRTRIQAGRLPGALFPESRGIRSTALGCAEFSVQLSGNTSYISDPARLLPRRNLKVLKPDVRLDDDVDPVSVAADVTAHLRAFGVDPSDPDLVLAFEWQGMPRFGRLQRFARGVADALAERAAAGVPVYVILDADVAMNFGAILFEALGRRSGLVVLDGLTLWDFDSIDIGSLREPSMTVPVTIKSLIFSDVRNGMRPREIVNRAPAVERRREARSERS